MRMRRKRTHYQNISTCTTIRTIALFAYQWEENQWQKVDPVIRDDSPKEDARIELREDDPHCNEIWTELKMTEEEVEWCKREKDWTERRKCDEADDNIYNEENTMCCENDDMYERYDSIVTCWNDSPLLRITDEGLTGREMCCSEYILHKIFLRKDSVNCTLNSVNPSVMPTYTSDNRSTSEDHISKSTLVKQDEQCWSMCQRVTPRRSVLKAHTAQALVNTTILSATHSLSLSPLMGTPSNISCQDSRISRILESDGDSPRSASPQSSEPDEDDAIFRNEKRSFEKLSDYISEGAASASRDTSGSGSESPAQQDRLSPVRRKEKEDLKIVRKEPKMSRGSDIINTLNDHCYHQPRSMERLVKRPTFSETDEEEEIDVVSYEKKATYLNFAQKQHDENQLALNFAEKQQNANQVAMNFAEKQHNANHLAANIDKTTVRRPRGRPPGPNSAKRKRAAQICSNEASGPPLKQARVQTYQRGQKRQKCARQWRTQTFEVDDEEDKRNLHNNMERQRRISMKNFFDVLKQHVPAIANKERVAKVTILRQAKVYINTLEAEDIVILPERKKLERQQQILKKKLEELQRLQNRMLRLQRRY
ncbi:uncharacterized protein LOC126858575 isoform X2 [Cataglyphis hispanica]|nr:uncharacterized protein LOC126858575 isoform X2 [Cataglyphis hispanica]